MKRQLIAVTGMIVVSLGGCTGLTNVVGPGAEPSSTPPMLVKQTVDGEEVNVWNSIAKFGPVPLEKAAIAEQICRDIGAVEPWGYHPKAKDVDGRELDGGGYLCRFE